MKKLKVVVCSNNKVKIKSTRDAFKTLGVSCTISHLDCPSKVRDQPMSYEEALKGARNRIEYARGLKSGADIFLAIESGIAKCSQTDKFFDFSYSLVQDITGKIEAVSKSVEFEIDPLIMHFIDKGSDLSQASSLVYNIENVGSTMGISGIVSNGTIPRSLLHMQPNIFAICDFLRHVSLNAE